MMTIKTLSNKLLFSIFGAIIIALFFDTFYFFLSGVVSAFGFYIGYKEVFSVLAFFISFFYLHANYKSKTWTVSIVLDAVGGILVAFPVLMFAVSVLMMPAGTEIPSYIRVMAYLIITASIAFGAFLFFIADILKGKK
jgi:hypothetical protein